jgi:hypothetical protein
MSRFSTAVAISAELVPARFAGIPLLVLLADLMLPQPKTNVI